MKFYNPFSSTTTTKVGRQPPPPPRAGTASNNTDEDNDDNDKQSMIDLKKRSWSCCSYRYCCCCSYCVRCFRRCICMIIFLLCLEDFITIWNLQMYYHHQEEKKIQQQLSTINTPNYNNTTNLTTTTTTISMNDDTSSYYYPSFISSCLLMMDDNHYLVEWLAYHYTFLPLRRLIVAIDPNSKTSPISILERYSHRNLMNITIWNDTDFFPKYKLKSMMMTNTSSMMTSTMTTEARTKIHRQRQSYFYLQCMKTLKKELTIVKPTNDDDDEPQQQQQQSPIWVTFIDTDEFIVLNDRTNHTTASRHHYGGAFNFLPNWIVEYLINIDTPNHQHQLHQQQQEHLHRIQTISTVQPTVYEMLIHPNNSFLEYNKQPCLPMSRLNIAVTESSEGWEDVQQWIPSSTMIQKLHQQQQPQPNNVSSATSTSSLQSYPTLTTNANTTTTTILTTNHSSSIWNGMNFKTLRYKYKIMKVMNGKAMIDLNQVVGNNDHNNNHHNDFNFQNINCHRPLKNYCTQKNIGISSSQAIFGVYQYGGTYEQYMFRTNDARSEIRTTTTTGNNNTNNESSTTSSIQEEKYMKLNYSTSSVLHQQQQQGSKKKYSYPAIIKPTNAARSWLSSFINQVGDDEGDGDNNITVAESLLQGIGEVNPQ